GAAHARVEDRRGDAAVDHADRVVHPLGRRQREHGAALLGLDDLHLEQHRDRGRRQRSRLNRPDVVEPGQLQALCRRCRRVLPAERARARGRGEPGLGSRLPLPLALRRLSCLHRRAHAASSAISGSAISGSAIGSEITGRVGPPAPAALNAGGPIAASARPAARPPATVISAASWKSDAEAAPVPRTATSSAIPSAAPIWRPIVSTAAPVAKRSGASEEAPAPVSVGITSPTPAPPIIQPGRKSAAYAGEEPVRVMNQTEP